MIPASWHDRLGGMRITFVAPGETTLEGRLADQAALKGVLDTLYGLYLPLLKVTSYGQQTHQKGDFSNEK